MNSTGDKTTDQPATVTPAELAPGDVLVQYIVVRGDLIKVVWMSNLVPRACVMYRLIVRLRCI